MVLPLWAIGGCLDPGHSPQAERNGKTFYLDGAGNWGYGMADVPTGLRQANYQGDVEVFVWTTSAFPLVDQLNIGAARIRAAQLASRIDKYEEKYPDRDVNVIALSAGTGVATWAVENLKNGVQINNLILLGSSLSANYDMSKALSHMTGKIYVYYSPNDAVLQAVRVVGTIDGKRGVDSAGQAGLIAPPGMQDRIVNIGWSENWRKLNWHGGHTDTTNIVFVRNEIAKHIVPEGAGQESDVALESNLHLAAHDGDAAPATRK